MTVALRQIFWKGATECHIKKMEKHFTHHPSLTSTGTMSRSDQDLESLKVLAFGKRFLFKLIGMESSFSDFHKAYHNQLNFHCQEVSLPNSGRGGSDPSLTSTSSDGSSMIDSATAVQ